MDDDLLDQATQKGFLVLLGEYIPLPDPRQLLADGSNVTALTKTHLDYDPTWSPSGRKIAFIPGDLGRYELFTMNADGSNARPLTHDGNAKWSPSWSPDGSKIAFTWSCSTYFDDCLPELSSQSWDIYTINVDGNNLTNITSASGSDTQAD
jgi:TolB protein